jgi:hypothetical protein
MWILHLDTIKKNTETLTDASNEVGLEINVEKTNRHRPPIWLSALPLNLTYILIVILTLLLVNLPYTNF